MSQTNPRNATLSDLVAEEVRALMARRQMSGRTLALKLNVSPSWVSYRLSGKQPIDLNDLALIAQALDVTPFDLMPAREMVAAAAKPINERSTPTGPTTSGITTTRRSTHRPAARVSAGQRRPMSVRSPGYTMPSAHAA